ncbi:hypothetical protein ACET96_09860 [Aeromonas dhakensis]|uniref:hypothetical protein n=1 Tax=Aeromonas dhakensis TaxID=196024 RepID=UPI00290D373F|nr:hypothetical protein [Aeromonas dhakensis]
MFINQYLLSEPRLYELICDQLLLVLTGQQSHLDMGKVKEVTYASWHLRNYTLPDQIFLSHWRNLQQRMQEDCSLSRALLGQAARYHFEPDERYISVQLDKFDQWQNWIANQSGLPVIAYQISINKHYQTLNNFEKFSWIKDKLGYRSLVSPYHPLVDDYIEREGLHESHMHLNGTSLLESMWHHALLNPNLIVDKLLEGFNSPRVRLLYSTNTIFDHPKKFGRLLKIARLARELLLSFLSDSNQVHKEKHNLHQELLGVELKDSINFNFENNHFLNTEYWSHTAEIHWQSQLIKKLSYEKHPVMDICFLLYITSVNCFQRIIVQRDDQYGFDQFQKFADDGVREEFEKEYAARFYQLHGPKHRGRPDIATLEGRFAPKPTLEKNLNIVSSILRGFLVYAGDNNYLSQYSDLDDIAKKVLEYKRPTLRLVSHFIKSKWVHNDEPHFMTLRKNLFEKSFLLFDMLNKHPVLRQIITGVDVAANEIEAPPEVFSTLYRNCRRNGIMNFTYHVGEDFEHLLSGIRAIFDAIILLDLKNGDRIGHATAIGIPPDLWINNMPDHIFLSQGQWLENLLFLRHISLNTRTNIIPLDILESKIADLAHNIFNIDKIQLEDLQEFFLLRGLEPEVVKSIVDVKSLNITGWLYQEYLEAKKTTRPNVLFLLKERWFSPNVIARYEQEKQFPLNFISRDILIYSQQFTQKLLSERKVIIETLPTSNVRISHYSSMKDHHIFRWMQIPSRKIEGDYPMLISLGSDDPGIFATDLRNEFYHIFSILVCEFKYSPSQALTMISEINENGRVYRFDYNNVVAKDDSHLAEK